MVYTLFVSFFIGIFLISGTASGQTSLPDQDTLRTWIREMKQSSRGPFKRIRWFCADGSVLPPKPYACEDRGGGVQHGEWSDRARTLRAHGYHIANVLADIKAEDFVDDSEKEEILRQILLEQFLVASDNGWIFRKAFYYPGALQVEDETKSGHNLLLALVNEPEWRDGSFIVLHEAVRLVPHKKKGASITRMRQLALTIAEKDEGFKDLRVKIHVRPDAGDAERVRAYAARKGVPELSKDYERLAAAIDSVYQQRDLNLQVLSVANRLKDSATARALKRNAAQLSGGNAPATRLNAAGYLLAVLRDEIFHVDSPTVMLAMLDLSLELEREVFRAGNVLLENLGETTRRERLFWLQNTVTALYGIGLISSRELQALRQSLASLTKFSPTSDTYKSELEYLARASEWGNRRLSFEFSGTVEHLATIEPLARRYMHDRLHGSPLLFYAAVLDSLIQDSNRLLGIRHELFGKAVGGGLRGLNPGLARGILRFPRQGKKFDRKGIYVLPATTENLPPIAGIVTVGEGNSLSHVQLLARNLGIPNVVVDRKLLSRLRVQEGRGVVLAVSSRGVVRLAEDGPEWDDVFGREGVQQDTLIRPDLGKLDLGRREIMSLERLRASDSGRIAGPKAANLGELKRHFQDDVPEGLVIPFGFFRALLDLPLEPGGPSVFRWMKKQYRTVSRIDDDSRRREETHRFLKRLRQWILKVDPGADFRDRLRAAMVDTFGAEGTYGVFVRSDTNVEDLPGFTGAGLNRTVPNVVGFEAVLEAIHRVWASPFEERAYAWRQAHMKHPEHVYASVLLMKSVPADKSGVMVTVDLERGSPDWLSVAVNEGVGGAVAGQEAEELRINTRDGQVRLLTQATEPLKGVLLPEGGVAKTRASGSERVLEREEIAQLIELAETLPGRFPPLRNAKGTYAPADIEFGFYQGHLVLFQIRPFLESSRARRSLFLNSLDRETSRTHFRSRWTSIGSRSRGDGSGSYVKRSDLSALK
ncbi:MAG: hypothetical protein GTN81_09400 [Proteobacteria bacterium]|nr:hypothetical protein [Pseudomonadota bacterium]